MGSTRKGLAVCIGIDDVPRLGKPLHAAESIAADMAALARALGYGGVTTLTGAAATRHRVLKALRGAADAAAPGDIVLLTFAGHGGRLLLDADRDDELVHECWHLHDAPLADVELDEALLAFAPGVRVLVVSESCFAGGMAREEGPRRSRGSTGGPSVRYLLAAPENAAAWATRRTGAFTRALAETLAAREGLDSYRAFHAALSARFLAQKVAYARAPVYDEAGPRLADADWGAPFAVDPSAALPVVPAPAPEPAAEAGTAAETGRLTRFLARLMGNEDGLLDRFLDPSVDASQRVRMLQDAGLGPRAAGVVLREDAEGALGLVAAEVLGWARQRQAAAGEASHQALWPGASLLASGVHPGQARVGREVEVDVKGWHFPARPEAFRVVFVGPNRSVVSAEVLDRAPVDAWGQWSATVKLTLPTSGDYAVYLADNDRGEVSSLPKALRGVVAVDS